MHSETLSCLHLKRLIRQIMRAGYRRGRRLVPRAIGKNGVVATVAAEDLPT